MNYQNIRSYLNLDLILTYLDSIKNLTDCSKRPDEACLIRYLVDDIQHNVKDMMDKVIKYKDRDKSLDPIKIEMLKNTEGYERNNPVNYGCDCGECMDCGIADDYCKDKFNKTRGEMIKTNEE